MRKVLLLIGASLLSHSLAAQLNPAFGVAGKRQLSVDVYDQVADVETLPDDHFALLLWCGHVDGAFFNADAVVMKCNADGSPDVTFGQGGVARFDFYGMDYSTTRDLQLLPDGKLLVLGNGNTFANPAQSPMCLARLNADGSMDTTFGEQGSAFIQFYEGVEFPGALTTMADGSLFLAGASYDTLGNHNVPVVAHLHEDLLPDSSFGGTGKSVIDFIAGLQSLKTQHLVGGEAYDLLPLADGSLLVCGSYGANAFVTRLTAAGIFDSTFAVSGHYIFQMDAVFNNRVEKMLLLPDSTVLLGVAMDEPFAQDYYLMRMSPSDGSILGSATIDFDGHEDELSDLTLLPDGKVLISGQCKRAENALTAGYRSDYFSFALLPDFTQLNTIIQFLIPFDSLYQSGASCATAFSDGSAVVAGFTFTSEPGETDVALMGLDAGFLALSNWNSTDEFLNVFPNPFSNEIWISSSSYDEILTVEILNLQGGLIWQNTDAIQAWEPISLPPISAGIYFMQVKLGNGKVIVKRIVRE